MDIWIQDRNTKRVIKAPASTLKSLGPNWRRVNPPREATEPVDRTTPEKKEAETKPTPPTSEQVKEEPTSADMKAQQPEEENPEPQLTTRQDYLNALKMLGVKKKGLHLNSLEKLKKEYEDATTQ